jgi:selenocysteine-specific elongation factor
MKWEKPMKTNALNCTPTFMSSSQRKDLISTVIEFAQRQGHATFNVGTFCDLYGECFNDREVARALDCLHSQKKLIRLNDGRFLSVEAMQEIIRKITGLIIKKGNMSLNDCREVLGYGRMRAIPILDYLDSIGLTRREGSVRVLASNIK